MCEMLNLFIPAKRPPAVAAVRGLEFVQGGEVHRGFRARFADQGTILAGTGSGPCLCGFSDWPALYELVRQHLTASGVTEVAFLKFWAGDDAPLTDRVIDPDDDEQCLEVADGVVVIARTGPAEPRRHRRVVRELERRRGQPVTLRRKTGPSLHGVLVAFDPESEVGDLDGAFFVASQVYAVDDPAPASVS